MLYGQRVMYVRVLSKHVRLHIDAHLQSSLLGLLSTPIVTAQLVGVHRITWGRLL